MTQQDSITNSNAGNVTETVHSNRNRHDHYETKVPVYQKPSGAFIMTAWLAMGVGIMGYLIGIWRSGMQLNEQGYYFTVLMLGLFSAISVQKSVRDRLEGIPVTDLYYGICWVFTLASIVLITIGLWNAELEITEKMMYTFAFVLSMFGVITVQKNVRDNITPKELEE